MKIEFVSGEIYVYKNKIDILGRDYVIVPRNLSEDMINAAWLDLKEYKWFEFIKSEQTGKIIAKHILKRAIEAELKEEENGKS